MCKDEPPAGLECPTPANGSNVSVATPVRFDEICETYEHQLDPKFRSTMCGLNLRCQYNELTGACTPKPFDWVHSAHIPNSVVRTTASMTLPELPEQLATKYGLR